MATVTLEHITKSYKAKGVVVRAVADLNLKMKDREFIVLVGPSGCGKTTTLRLVAGLEEVDAGTILIGDRVVNNVAPKDRDIAMVFQNYALYPHMTVFKNMGFGLKMRRVPKDEIKRKVHEVAGMLGIESLLDRKPAALSGGERQRVAVGRAIVRRPQVFLFDEPLSNLDAKLRTHMRTEIKSLHRKLQATIIYVTHDQEEAMTLGDRLVVMKGGVVQQCGTPLDVYNRPVNRFVGGFIGRPPMNFLEGRLKANDDTLFFSGGEQIWLEVPAAQAKALQQHVGRQVVLGIRPEHVQLTGAAGQQAHDATDPSNDDLSGGVDMSITVVEPLGDRTHVHGTMPGGASFAVQTQSTTDIQPGQQRTAVIDMTRGHFFAASEAGERLDQTA